MCIFQQPAFCIYVVYQSIGKQIFFYSIQVQYFNNFSVFLFFKLLFLCRYFAIVRPLEYPLCKCHSHTKQKMLSRIFFFHFFNFSFLDMTQKTVFLMLANVWMLPALISFTPIFLGWYTTEEQLILKKLYPNECSFVVNKPYAIISSSVSFWIPGIVMCAMYYRIFK